MNHLEHINQLHDTYSSKVDFLTIYIAEAHATDGWVFKGNKYEIQTHRSFDERLFAAAMLKRAGVKGPLAVDPFSNDAEKSYAALPERLFLIEDGVITFASGKRTVGYAKGIKDITRILKERFA